MEAVLNEVFGAGPESAIDFALEQNELIYRILGPESEAFRGTFEESILALDRLMDGDDGAEI